MTRDERAAQHILQLRKRQAVLEKQLAHAEAQQQVQRRKAREKRRYLRGALVEDAGLDAWSDADLSAVLHILSALRDTPQPAARLNALLHGVTPNGTWMCTQDLHASHVWEVLEREGA